MGASHISPSERMPSISTPRDYLSIRKRLPFLYLSREHCGEAPDVPLGHHSTHRPKTITTKATTLRGKPTRR